MKRLITRTDENHNTFSFWAFVPRGKHRGRVPGAFGATSKRNRPMLTPKQIAELTEKKKTEITTLT
jgi:hypothetical protein